MGVSYDELRSKNRVTTEVIENKLDGSTRMIGMPHQLLAHNDPRLGIGSDLGRIYAEEFLVEAPTICIKPGIVRFLPGADSKDRTAFLEAMIKDGTAGMGNADNIIQILQDDDNDTLQYFDHEGRFGSYMKSVNMLAQNMAVLLGLDKVEVPWEKKKITFGKYDWTNYRLGNQYGYSSDNLLDDDPDIGDETENWLTKLASVADEWIADDGYIQLYVDSSASYNESISNSTRSSMLESFTGQFQDMAKELGFVLGLGAGSSDVQDALSTTADNIDSVVDNLNKGNSGVGGILGTVVSRLSNGAKSVIQGGNFILPEMWDDSSYDKSGFSFSLTLSTPYGGKLAWYINVGIGMCFILGFSIPLQLSANTYRSPMILKCYSPGWWNCSLGIVDQLGIDKGGDGDWNIYGLPNTVRLSLSVKELYSTLTLPSNVTDFVSNNGMMEFLMTNCGIDVTNQKLSTKWKVLVGTLNSSIQNYVSATATNVVQSIRDNIRSKLGLI